MPRRVFLEALKYSPDQPRDDHGRFGSGGDAPSVTVSKPTHATTIEQAIQLLGDGKGVMFDRPDQAVTLIHRLAAVVQDAKAHGQQAKTYDLCKVSVAHTNLFCVDNVHIPRNKMPQLTGVPTPGSPADKLPRGAFNQVDIGPAWRDSLIARGFTVEDASTDPALLRASQNQLNGAKVAGLLAADEAGTLPPSRLWVSDDNYIVDGHHRWAADVTLNLERDQPLNADIARVNMPILPLLQDANNFAASMGIAQAGVASTKGMQHRRERKLLTMAEFEQTTRRALKYSPDQARDDHGRFGEGGTTTAATSADAVASVKAGATRNSRYRAISESDYQAMQHAPLLAGAHNEERLGVGAAFADKPEGTLHYVEPHVPHRIIRVEATNPAFKGHMRSGYPGTYAIDAPITPGVLSAVSPSFVVNERVYDKGMQRRTRDSGVKYSPDQPRDERGRFGTGDGSAAASTPPSERHAVGVSDDPNSVSLLTKTPGQQPGESDEAYNQRIFDQGMELYPPAQFLEDAAKNYREGLGLVSPQISDWRAIENPTEREKAIGAAFAAAKSDPNDPLVKQAYADLVSQTGEQWHLLTDPKADGGFGVHVDFVSPEQIKAGYSTGLPDKEGLNPYPTAQAQRDDLVNNGHLAIASIADYPEAAHPLLDSSRGGEYDMFRAVHDSFGHAAIGADFTRHGEYEAWTHHASMFYGAARQAASTELTGENSFLVTTHTPADHKAALLDDTLVSLPFDNKGNFDPNFYPGQVAALAGAKSAHRMIMGGEAEVVAKYGIANSRNALFGKIARSSKKVGMQRRRELKYSPDQPRDDHGRFGSGGDSSFLGDRVGNTAVMDRAPVITAAEARGDSRGVSAEEFERLASEGRARLADMAAHGQSVEGMRRNFTALKAAAFHATRASWGGVTIDPATGTMLDHDANVYALSVKPAGLSSVEVPLDATQTEFNERMDVAAGYFHDALHEEGHYLGVFRDDDNNRIDIDPVVVVDNLHDVETIGAASHAIGGAYNFADGNGYFPPHVDESKAAKPTVHYRGPGQWRSAADAAQRQAPQKKR